MKFTYYTIIGRDVKMIDGHLKNITSVAGFNKLECEKELVVIVYTNPSIPPKTTADILDVCETYGARVRFYVEPHKSFIHNLYACFNLGYEVADDGLVFRGGSDQIFSKDAFVYLYNAYMGLENKNVILQANTVENEPRGIQNKSRHILADLGDTYESFDDEAWQKLCADINNGVDKELLNVYDSIKCWNKPTTLMTTIGEVDRTDGCSWLMTREDWVKYGPMPPFERGITGDVVIHDRLQQAGFDNLIVRDCITYHFVRGERLE